MNTPIIPPKKPVPLGLKLLENNQHDATFKAAMALPHVYRPFFKAHLPPVVASHMDFDSIEPVEASFVDEQLKASLCDKLFKAQWGEHTGYLVLLAEHQSTSCRLMPLRLLRYILNILEHAAAEHEERARPLPLVYPLVLYHNVRHEVAVKSCCPWKSDSYLCY